MGNYASSADLFSPGPLVEAEEFVQRNLAKPGDLISFPRKWYRHWGVYEGDGNVIHVPAEDKHTTSTEVKREKIIDVANRKPGYTKVQVDNLLGEACLFTHWKCMIRCDFNRTVDQQLETARQLIGKTIPYNLCYNNCEHFATECKYGVGFSSQTYSRSLCFLYHNITSSCHKMYMNFLDKRD